ncbi:MAG: histidinol-phosphatase HisJ family protein [Candidatus Krumholzibacteriota bacterium]|nr:histidinol-phosphatase HisJ family protein [Candidatus Krumholzibacteriota bacterium]
MIDYHLHGNFCGHGSGTLGEYVEAALGRDLVEIGFSAHLPKVVDPDPYHAMLEEDLPRYVETVLSLRERYRGRISIKLGIEADFFEGHEDATRRLLDAWPFDYVLGSIHFLGDWHFTSREGLPRYETADPEEAFPRYFEQVRRLVDTGLFDILAHPDAIKRERFRPARTPVADYESVAERLACRGMAIEVNTGGLRRRAGSIYPDAAMLAACARRGVPVTLGSDAHSPADVGRDFDEAYRLLAAVGIDETAVFDRRRLALRPVPAAK